jgi:hypothetical protein
MGYTRHKHGNTQKYHQYYDDLVGRHNIFCYSPEALSVPRIRCWCSIAPLTSPTGFKGCIGESPLCFSQLRPKAQSSNSIGTAPASLPQFVGCFRPGLNQMFSAFTGIVRSGVIRLENELTGASIIRITKKRSHTLGFAILLNEQYSLIFDSFSAREP